MDPPPPPHTHIIHALLSSKPLYLPASKAFVQRMKLIKLINLSELMIQEICGMLS